MIAALYVLYVLDCLFLILVVLLQAGKGDGMGAAFGGTSSTVLGNRGAATFLSRLTVGSAVLFMLLSVVLAFHSSTPGSRLTQRRTSNIPFGAPTGMGGDDNGEAPGGEEPGDDSEQPSGDDSEQPAVDDTEQPASDDTEQPAGDDTEQPAGDDTEQPAGDDTAQPAGDGTEQPAGEVPSESDGGESALAPPAEGGQAAADTSETANEAAPAEPADEAEGTPSEPATPTE